MEKGKKRGREDEKLEGIDTKKQKIKYLKFKVDKIIYDLDSYFSKKFMVDGNLRELFNKANEEGNLNIKFKDNQIIKVHSNVLKISSEIFEKWLSHDMKESKSMEINVEDFEKKNILCVFKWIYIKRFENMMKISEFLEILRFSHMYQIRSYDKDGTIVYLFDMLNEYFVKVNTNCLRAPHEIITLPNNEVYQKIRNHYITKFSSMMKKCFDYQPNSFCPMPRKDVCCFHTGKNLCINNPLFCCIHFKNVVLSTFWNLDLENQQKIMELIMDIKYLDEM